MTNDMKTLNPGQIITITEGFYHNALGVYKVLKPITKDVIDSTAQEIIKEIQDKDFEAAGEIWEVYPDECLEHMPGHLVILGYIEKIDAFELFLGDSKINPETFEA